MQYHHTVAVLLDRLKLEPEGELVFHAKIPDDGRRHAFGGLIAAQSLRAACNTIDGLEAHSLHAYFLRPGMLDKPVRYVVTKTREGRSFATRLVEAFQGDDRIFTMTASFHRLEPGLEHQMEMPEAPDPESLPDFDERFAKYRGRVPDALLDTFTKIERPFDHREPMPFDFLAPEPQRGQRLLWFRAVGPVEGDANLHRCVLTYATDLGLLDNCIIWHGKTFMDPKLFCASIDHAVWFHRPVRADDWLLYVTESPSSGNGRGMNFGRIFQRDGALVATTAQESLMRVGRR
jgi:acyl-CoA thioesterase-2